MKKALSYILIVSALFAISACKRTSDTFTSRVYHGMVSQFNPLFNGEQALLKGEQSLKDGHVDDFDEILAVYQWGTAEQATGVKPDMEKAVEKSTKVIQRHSMMIRNDQKNKYIDDSYMLMGKARFYLREYQLALETFNYVIQEFPKEKAYFEASLWAARCEMQIGNYLNAKDRYDKLYRHEDLPKKLRGDAFASYAQLEINQKRYENAYQLLQQAIDKSKDKSKKVRWLYISGQLQSDLGNDFEASEIFDKVISKADNYELRFNAQLNKARNYDTQLGDPQRAYDELKKMLADDKNYENRDQIYYVMALVSEKLDEIDQMEDYLKESIRVSTSNNLQKGKSYLKLAETYFALREYVTAQAYYDSTASNLPKEHPKFEEVSIRKESLGELVEHLNTIELQDSLQALANMSEEQRLGALADYIEAQDEKKRKTEEEAASNAFASQGDFSDNTATSANGQWYFYNPGLRSVGQQDFNQRFGNRKLEDNWRRADKNVFQDVNTNSGNDGDVAQNNEGGEDKPSASVEERAKGMLKDIPLTEEAMAVSDEKIINAFMGVGTIYKDDLKDYPAAIESQEELLRRYPGMEEEARIWYVLYRIHTLAGESAEAEKYKNLILSKYPNSAYADILLERDSSEEVDETQAAKLYTMAYQNYLGKDYKLAFNQDKEGIAKFITSDYGARFSLLKGFLEARLGRIDSMKSSLRMVVARFPETDQAEEARKILNQMGESVEEASADGAAEEGKKNLFKIEFTAEHKYIIVVPQQGTSANDVRIALTDFNQQYYPNDKLKTKAIILNEGEQIIIVNSFPNSVRAQGYLDAIESQNVLNKLRGIKEFKHFVISNSNFPKFYQQRNAEDYLSFYEESYKKKEK